MSTLDNLTLKEVRFAPNLNDSRFWHLYLKLFDGGRLRKRQRVELLTFAILFVRSPEEHLNKLGYRVILQYTDRYNDFRPLYSLALLKGLAPIAASIESFNPSVVKASSFANAVLSADKERLKLVSGDTTTYRTKEQIGLRQFALTSRNFVVVAPTSYGKSEMMVDRVVEMLDKNVCVIVPTKALVAQTKRNFLRNSRIRAAKVHIVTHPDGFRGGDSVFLVMTQERLYRLMQIEPGLQLDALLVDEAHNLLDGDSRSTQLSQVILAAHHRNPQIEINYYTPFLADHESINHAQLPHDANGKSVVETVKVEKLHYIDVSDGNLFLYDQFLDRSILQKENAAPDSLSFVTAYAGQKNLLYSNRPKQAEKVAVALSKVLPESDSRALRRASAAIADLIHPEYGLLDCMKHGVLFHHGSVPELLRDYVEDVFAQSSDEPQYLSTTSTLLEGVNTPADTLFIMNPKRGRSNLSPSAFKNLVGRVGRFKEIFSGEPDNLSLLQPKVYVVKGEYAPARFNPQTFLKSVADVTKPLVDRVDNPLLAKNQDHAAREKLLEFLENTEVDMHLSSAGRRASTDVGLLCFKHGVHDFDIFAHEETISRRLQIATAGGAELDDVGQIVPFICNIFLQGVDLTKEAEPLDRVRNNSAAQNFYTMFLEWRSKGSPYKKMISSFLKYWSQLEDSMVYVGSTWGEETYGDTGFLPLFVNMARKSRGDRVNLAVAKVKEEQDFVDYRLIKYLEILNDLALIDANLFERIKYGTDDKTIICMLKNGFSYELARVLARSHRAYFEVDLANSRIQFDESLLDSLRADGVNEVLVFEAECHL